MVYHFSSKLSHLAQSFKPQQHFNSVRNAFPSSAPTVGASGNAGSRANGWNYQHNRLVTPSSNANTDTIGRGQEEDEDELISISNRRISLQPRISPAHKIQLFVKEKLPSILVEKGVSTRFITEQRYGAFRNRTEAEKDLETSNGNEMRTERKVISASRVISGTGRRASISRSMISSTPITSAIPVQIRSYTTSPFLNSSPPLATLTKIRRNSTSSISRPLPATIELDSTSHYDDPEPDSSRLNSAFGTGKGQFPSANAYKRYQTLKSSRQVGNIEEIEAAIRRYESVAVDYNVLTHHLVLEILLQIRKPNTSLEKIMRLYNQMFDHANLGPSNRTFELIILAFCKRDREVLSSIRYLKNRTAKVSLLTEARGVWHVETPVDQPLPIHSKSKLEIEKLQAEDYFTPALKIYKALGSASDLLKVNVVNALLEATAARGRIDLTLSIFSRLEKSKMDKPNSHTFEILLKMFGEEKDSIGVKEVFESYLTARESGGLRVLSDAKPNKNAPIAFERTPTKHRHASSVTWDYSTTTFTENIVRGDESVWKSAIRAFFAAGDSVSAVELVERMTKQIELGEPKVGYPVGMTGATLTSMIAGFLDTKDFESAETWWNKSLEIGNLNHLFFGTLFYVAVDARHAVLVNKIFSEWLKASGSGSTRGRIGITEFVTIIDLNLADSYNAPTPELRKIAIDKVIELQNLLKTNSELINVSPDFYLSSGSTQRIVQALAFNKCYTEAVDTYVSAIQDLKLSGVFQDDSVGPDVFRTQAKWINNMSGQIVLTALGQLPTGRVHHNSPHNVTAFLDSDRPALAQVIKATTAARMLRASAGLSLAPSHATTVYDSYIAAKAQEKGDVSKLGLDGEGFLTVIEAFALVSRFDGIDNFPGFNSIMDDFASSGTTFLPTTSFKGLVKLLRAQELREPPIIQILSILDQEILTASREGRTVDEILALRNSTVVAEVARPMDLSPHPSKDFKNIKSQDPNSALAQSARPAISLPTPPPTVPDYLLQFGSMPTFTESFQLNPDLSYKIDQLIQSKAKFLYDTVKTSAANGIYPHVESLARLVEQIGREGNIEAVRELYLLAYGILMKTSTKVEPRAHSISWILLEDHMIIALCQLGYLDQVAIHRDRLLKAGSAPSADGYAAMILNMKETTDDAAVALELFEESQRLNVPPNVYLFNTLISKLSRARRASDALEYFEYMKEVGLIPSSITYGAIINACCKTGDDASADYLFEEMVKSPGFKARVPPYNTMIQFYTQTKPDRERALFYYDALLKAGVKPTGHTYKLLLDAYGSIGTPDPVSLQAIFDKLQLDKSITLTGTHWASLINAWGCHSKNLDKAMEIFESIASHPSTRKSGVALPDAVVYESLLNACLANHRGDLCEKYLKDMATRGVRMTAYVVNTLIKGYASQLALPSARALFESLEDPPAGVAASYNHPTDRTSKNHVAPTPSLTDPIYREPSTWETMIRVELGSGQVANAQALLVRLEARAFPEPVVKRIRALVFAADSSLPTSS